MVVGNVKATSFWHDKWCGQVTLADKFPQLYIKVKSGTAQLKP
jgi:hypothetical protein